MKKFLTTFIVLAGAAVCFSQPRSGMGSLPRTGIIRGQVTDAQEGIPIEYANVVLYRMRDTTQRWMAGMDTNRVVSGTVTDAQGRFVLRELPPGRFYLEVSFIGYKTRRVEDIRLAPDGNIDLGRLTIEPAVISMPGAEVTADKPRIEYKIDKKIINVAQDPALQSGTAVDALEKAPAVKVDIEGNVTLRGLSSFTVLVDGKPSVVDGSEALQQIPASTIERIEIVTNPSAKFDPEGKAGIINVILKKQRASGLSGVLNLNLGNNASYGGNLLLTLRQGIATFYFSPNFNQMNFPGNRVVNRWVERDGIRYFSSSTGTMNFGRQFYGIRIGADFQPNANNYLSLGTRLGGMAGTRSQEADYEEWRSGAEDTTRYRGVTSSTDRHPQVSAYLEANHNFGKKDHKATVRLNYSGNWRNGSDWSENRIGDSVFDGKMTTDTRNGNLLDWKLDYSLPLREKDRLEAGYQARLRRMSQRTTFAQFNPATGGYESLAQYSHRIIQGDDAQAIYSSYSLNWHDFGAMLGLRTEFTGRSTTVDSAAMTPVYRWDFFPSAHLSYSFPQERQVMASYTRRIDRPRGWDLSPETTWMDANNVRTGNPALLPELIDSYEAGLVFPLGKHRISLDGYYRVTHNVIERFQRVWQGAVLLNTVENVGTEYALGSEFNLDFAPFSFWNITLSGDIYDQRLRTVLPEAQSTAGFNWEGGITTDFTLPTMTRIQLSARYEGPRATVQGKEAGRIWTSAGVRQVLFNRQLLLSLSVRDIFAQSLHESENQGENFYSYHRFARRAPTVALALTYNFNNYKPERRRQNQDNGDEELMRPYDEY